VEGKPAGRRYATPSLQRRDTRSATVDDEGRACGQHTRCEGWVRGERGKPRPGSWRGAQDSPRSRPRPPQRVPPPRDRSARHAPETSRRPRAGPPPPAQPRGPPWSCPDGPTGPGRREGRAADLVPSRVPAQPGGGRASARTSAALWQRGRPAAARSIARRPCLRQRKKCCAIFLSFCLQPRMSGGFEDLGLMPELVRATQEQGWLCVPLGRAYFSPELARAISLVFPFLLPFLSSRAQAPV
jgi:hypothetical protein